jgi:RNA polymerase sigma-70 factor (ECF subfamily)
LRQCASITGNLAIAEDLAQETLLEAWSHLDGLRDAEKLPNWLSGIARNVCLRWLRKQSRDNAHFLKVDTNSDTPQTEFEDLLLDDFDLEFELERQELAELLDKALDLLPPETRRSLLERYVQESSLAEVATQLGMSVHATAMRLQRGKLALRQILNKELHLEANDFTLTGSAAWEPTSLWCHNCGQQHLLSKFNPELGELHLKCPACSSEPGDYINTNSGLVMLGETKSLKAALNRLTKWAGIYYRTALREGSVPCVECGHTIDLRFGMPENASTLMRQRNSWIICLFCEHCRSRCYTTLDSLSFSLPEVKEFRRRYPRIRTLPLQYIQFEGANAMLTTYESVTNNSRIEVISSLESFEVLKIAGGQ